MELCPCSLQGVAPEGLERSLPTQTIQGFYQDEAQQLRLSTLEDIQFSLTTFCQEH